MKILLIGLLFSLTLFAQSDSSRAVGFYSNGKIINSVELPSEGNGFVRLFVEHDRGYGTLEMIKMIMNAATEMNNLYPGKGRLQIEDIAAPQGGPVNDNHKSHQNGLDVDITYYRSNGTEHVPHQEGYKYGVPMVEEGRISALFDTERTWQLIKLLHKHGRVQRIFMDQVIKAELCQYARNTDDFDIEVLRSIRHEDNHADHMHVRLRCPAKDKECVSQAEVAPGSGCAPSGENIMDFSGAEESDQMPAAQAPVMDGEA